MWISRSSKKAKDKPQLRDGLRIYAIGDIHGRADLLKNVLSQIDADCVLYPTRRPVIVFLGDYVDRGPASKEVLDLLIDCGRIRESVFLKGNHETFVQRFMNDPEILEDWRSCGGLETLMSYGLTPSLSPDGAEKKRLADRFSKSVPKDHLEFIASLELSYLCDDFLFVHAGIRPDVALDKQTEDDMLWIREEFLSCERPFEKFVVHGHTPVSTADIRSNRANIDTGAFATGRLTCVVIEGATIVPLMDAREWTIDAADTRGTIQNLRTEPVSQP